MSHRPQRSVSVRLRDNVTTHKRPHKATSQTGITYIQTISAFGIRIIHAIFKNTFFPPGILRPADNAWGAPSSRGCSKSHGEIDSQRKVHICRKPSKDGTDAKGWYLKLCHFYPVSLCITIELVICHLSSLSLLSGWVWHPGSLVRLPERPSARIRSSVRPNR